MGLEKYHTKRDFNKTAEPKGKVHKQNNFLFVIQKHAASHLHYDFRIELDGVLKSWAIPKGPCCDPKVKRLAMHVEDHPIEYGTFEGIIPKGEYGGGTVLLWDQGSWVPLDENPAQAYHKGHLRFDLKAEKLGGRWDLIRFKGKTKNDNTWFLIKYQDQYARPLDEFDITTEAPDSIKSGQSLDEITESHDAKWTRAKGLETVTRKLEKKKIAFEKVTLHFPPSPFPEFIKPQLATLVNAPPQGDEWVNEIKFDGYRILAYKKGKKITLLSRNNKDWTKEFASIAKAMQKLPLENVVLDGEMVILDEKSRSNFQLLQNHALGGIKKGPIYYVFDLLYYADWDVRNLNLLERKTLLEPLLSNVSPQIRYSDHIVGQSARMFKHACQFELEGIIAKRIDSPYLSKRSATWLKIKCVRRQEFIIGGYTPPQGSRSYFGSLFLGVFTDEGELQFCGNVGTGFTQKSLAMVGKALKKLRTEKNPFNSRPPGVTTATWVKPKLIAEVEFSEWTREGHLRHPSFKGLREDKKASAIRIEKEASVHSIEAQLPETKQAKEFSKISNPGKIMYPEDNISKGDVYAYYEKVCPYILPYIQKRPLTLVRCPAHYMKCFFQKHFNKSSSKALYPLPIESSSHQLEEYMYLTDGKGLLGLVQMGVLEIHPWGSTIDHLECPDMLIFDLDPAPDVSWAQVVSAAQEIKDYLQQLELVSFVKTTGGKGLHVVVPIKPEYDWDIIKNFSQLFANFVQNQHPERYVTNMSKAKRQGKIFLDYLRNQKNATAVAAYSTRARLHAPVSTPLAWDELTANYEDTFYTIFTLPPRLDALKKDPWEGFFQVQQRLKIK